MATATAECPGGGGPRGGLRSTCTQAGCSGHSGAKFTDLSASVFLGHQLGTSFLALALACQPEAAGPVPSPYRLEGSERHRRAPRFPCPISPQLEVFLLWDPPDNTASADGGIRTEWRGGPRVGAPGLSQRHKDASLVTEPPGTCTRGCSWPASGAPGPAFPARPPQPVTWVSLSHLPVSISPRTPPPAGHLVLRGRVLGHPPHVRGPRGTTTKTEPLVLEPP